MMKKEYTTPIITIKEISSADIITASGLTNGITQSAFKKFDGNKFKDVGY
ncbi:MAG: hypothetical protein IJL89_10315 [Firmicutes bacterium]|nr:hypothetical protein [Bacillota bacterium]